MSELVSAIPIGQLGINGATIILLALLIRAIIKGDLVPRLTLEDTKAERDHWRTVAEKERDGHEETRRQVSRLVDASRSFDHSWESIREQGREGSPNASA